MELYTYPEEKKWPEICKRPEISREELFPKIREIFKRVKSDGDSALKYYTKRFDSAEIDEIRCTADEIAASERSVPEKLKSDIRLASENIRLFHSSQRAEIRFIETSPGVVCWRESRPVEKVGLYIPGGTAPLFSSVLMLGIPAMLAGCKEIVLCTPPRKDGSIHPAILWAAKETGIRGIYKAGGAQAIAAMTYGTESVPGVYKIFGPGNQYVTAAKLHAVTEGLAIDMPAGPSEVLVIADETANPVFIAADLLSQAEHGADSQMLLVTTDTDMPRKVNKEIQQQLQELPRSEIAGKALDNAKIIVLKNLGKCIGFSNYYAPEHLILQTRDAGVLTDKVMNAGSVFVGDYTPESAGDYASGTNHTLPTNAYAKNFSGISLDSYMKMLTFQKITKEGLRQIGPTIENMAASEELDAHKRAVSRRLQQIKEQDRE